MAQANDIMIKSSHAQSLRWPIKDAPEEFGVIRIFGHSPDMAMLQIRTRGSINESGGVPFHINSSAHLSLDTATELRDWLSVWITEHTD